MVLEAFGTSGCDRCCDAGSDGDRRDFKYRDSAASGNHGSAVCHVVDKGQAGAGVMTEGAMQRKRV